MDENPVIDVELIRSIETYAAMVLEWLAIDAKETNIHRNALVAQFIEALTALDQMKEE